MPRITNKVITDRFIAAFEGGKPFTPSEKRMMGIKLAQLKKTIKAHLESTGRQTDLSVEQIILDGIEYGVMTKCPWRSIASVGYNTLDPSMDYWEKRRKLETIKKEQRVEETKVYIQQQENNRSSEQKTVEQVRETSYNKHIPNRPAWMNIGDNDW